MPTAKIQTHFRWHGYAATVFMCAIFVIAHFGFRSWQPDQTAQAAPVPFQVEKKITIDGVDSTRAVYEMDDGPATAPPQRGKFRADDTNDDKDTAIGSKLKSVRILTRAGAEIPDSARDCLGKTCRIVVNTNGGGRITIEDFPNNVVALSIPQRQKYRHSQGGIYSRKIHVQSVTYGDTPRPLDCPSNRCSVEITYTVQ